MVDFKGQQLSEVIFQVVTISATVVGFFYGWYAQSFERTFQCWAVGVGVAVVLCVPDWWFYRKNPITWREPDYGDSVRPVSCLSARLSLLLLFVVPSGSRAVRWRMLPVLRLRLLRLMHGCGGLVQDDEEEEDDEDDEDADEEEDDENKAKKGGKSKDSKKNK